MTKNIHLLFFLILYIYIEYYFQKKQHINMNNFNLNTLEHFNYGHVYFLEQFSFSSECESVTQ